MYSIPIVSQSPTLLIYLNRSTDQICDSVGRIIDSFFFYPSIKNIERNYKITSKFSFKPVSEEFVQDIVNDLSWNKAAGGEIPLKILKECDFFLFSDELYQ